MTLRILCWFFCQKYFCAVPLRRLLPCRVNTEFVSFRNQYGISEQLLTGAHWVQGVALGAVTQRWCRRGRSVWWWEVLMQPRAKWMEKEGGFDSGVDRSLFVMHFFGAGVPFEMFSLYMFPTTGMWGEIHHIGETLHKVYCLLHLWQRSSRQNAWLLCDRRRFHQRGRS